MPALAILIMLGFIGAILKLNALCYLYDHVWSTRTFIIDVLIAMVLISIANCIVGSILLVVIMSSSTAFNAYVDFLLHKWPELTRFYTITKSVPCNNCAQVGIECATLNGKHCPKCGVSANSKEYATDVAGWAKLGLMHYDSAKDIPNSWAWHQKHGTSPPVEPSSSSTPAPAPKPKPTPAPAPKSFAAFAEEKARKNAAVNADDSFKKIGAKVIKVSSLETKPGSSSK